MIGPRGVLVPGAEGRTLKIRPIFNGEGVQLGIIGKRGGLVEAFCADLAQVPALVLGIDSVSEVAWAEFHSALRKKRCRLPFALERAID